MMYTLDLIGIFLILNFPLTGFATYLYKLFPRGELNRQQGAIVIETSPLKSTMFPSFLELRLHCFIVIFTLKFVSDISISSRKETSPKESFHLFPSPTNLTMQHGGYTI